MTETVYYNAETGEYLTEDEYNQSAGNYEEVGSYTENLDQGLVERGLNSLSTAGNSFLAGMNEIGERASGYADDLYDYGRQAFGYEATDDSIFDYAEQQYSDLAQERRDKTLVNSLAQGAYADSLYNQTVGAVPSIGATVLGGVPGITLQALSAGGNKADEIEQAGGGELEQVTGGAASGAMDYVFSRIGQKTLPSVTGRGLSQIAKTAAVEGLEEGATEAGNIALDGILPSLTLPTLEQGLKQIGTAATIGAMAGGAIETGRQVVTSRPVTRQQAVEESVKPTYKENVTVEFETDIEEPESNLEEIALLEYKPQLEYNNNSDGDPIRFYEESGKTIAQSQQVRGENVNTFLPSEGAIRQPEQIINNREEIDTAKDPNSQRNIRKELSKELAKQSYIDINYQKSLGNILENTKKLLINHKNIVDQYREDFFTPKGDLVSKRKIEEYTQHLQRVKPTVEKVETLQENSKVELTDEDYQGYFDDIVRDAQDVGVAQGTISPVFDNDEQPLDLDNLDFEIQENQGQTVIKVKDKFKNERGFIKLPVKNPLQKAQAQQVKTVLNQVNKNAKYDKLNKALKNEAYQMVVRAQEVKRLARLNGYNDVADTIELGQDVKYQTIGVVNEHMELAKDFYKLDDNQKYAVATGIIELRKFKAKNPNANMSDFRKVFSNANIKDKQGQQRKFTPEEIEGAIAIQNSSNSLLKNILSTDRDSKIDNIKNSVEEQKKRANNLRRQKKITKEQYDLLTTELDKFMFASVNSVTKKSSDAYKKMSEEVYFPLMRFGKYIVGMKNADGDLAEYHLAESKAEQQKILQELISKNPNKTDSDFFIQTRLDEPNLSNPYFNVPTPILKQLADNESEQTFTQFINQFKEQVETNAGELPTNYKEQIITAITNLENNTKDATQYFQQAFKTANSSDITGIRGRFVTPEFVDGYSEDFERAFSAYINQGANFVAGNRAHSFAMRTIQGMSESPARAYLKRYVEKVFRSENDKFTKMTGAIKSATYYNYIGFLNPSSPINNLIGGSLMLTPMLELQIQNNNLKNSTLSSLTKATLDSTQFFTDRKSFKQKLLTSNNVQDNDMLQLIELGEKQGLFTTGYYDQFIGNVKGSDKPKVGGNFLSQLAYTSIHNAKQIIKETDVLFRASESMLRAQAAFASFEATKNSGLPIEKRLFLAKDLVRDTAGDFSKGDRPFITQSNLGSVMTMFKGWGFTYLNNIKRMVAQIPKDKGKAIASYAIPSMLFTGMHKAVPFLADGLEMLAAMGFDYQDLEEDIGERSMDMFHYGIASRLLEEEGYQYPDISNAAGGSGIIPRVTPDKTPTENAGEILLGASGSILKNIYYGIDQWSKGNTYRALETAAPSGIMKQMRSAREAGYVSSQFSGIRDYKEQPIFDVKGEQPLEHTTFSLTMAHLGFPTTEISKGRNRYYRAKRLGANSRNNWLNRNYARLLEKGSEEEIRDFEASIEEHNSKADILDMWEPHFPTIERMREEYYNDPVTNLPGVKKNNKEVIQERVTRR